MACASNELLSSLMVGGDRAHVSASSCHHPCLCYRHVRWCRCGHTHVVVMFPSSLSSVRSRTFCLRVHLIALWYLRHAVLIESRSSSCGHHDLPIAHRVEPWAHEARISIIVRSGRAGAAARFVIVVVCPPSSLPLTCQVMWVRLRTHRHCAVAGSASEPFSSLIAEGRRGDAWCIEHMEVAGGDVGP